MQKDLLKSGIPVVKVIETLYKEKDTISSSTVDPIELIKTLTDSIAYVGSANLNMVKRRKDTIKPYLPSGFQKICSSVEFTGSLFGAKLQQQVKEINELSKFAGEMTKKYGTMTYSRRDRNYRQFPGSRGVRRGSKSTRFSSYNCRYKPYKHPKASNFNSPSFPHGGTK